MRSLFIYLILKILEILTLNDQDFESQNLFFYCFEIVLE